MKPINSETNDKSNSTEFYEQFLNELASILLYIYDFWGKLGTMGVTSRTGIVSVIYKNGDEKDIANYRSILLLSLDDKIFIIN